METKTDFIFCPVCSTGRPKPNLRKPWGKILSYTLFWSFISGSVVYYSWGIWPTFWVTPSVGVLVFLFLEFFSTDKVRKELICPICRFDPILYKRSPEEAKQKCLEGIKFQEEHFMTKWQQMKRAVFAEA